MREVVRDMYRDIAETDRRDLLPRFRWPTTKTRDGSTKKNCIHINTLRGNSESLSAHHLRYTDIFNSNYLQNISENYNILYFLQYFVFFTIYCNFLTLSALKSTTYTPYSQHVDFIADLNCTFGSHCGTI